MKIEIVFQQDYLLVMNNGIGMNFDEIENFLTSNNNNQSKKSLFYFGDEFVISTKIKDINEVQLQLLIQWKILI